MVNKKLDEKYYSQIFLNGLSLINNKNYIITSLPEKDPPDIIVNENISLELVSFVDKKLEHPNKKVQEIENEIKKFIMQRYPDRSLEITIYLTANILFEELSSSKLLKEIKNKLIGDKLLTKTSGDIASIETKEISPNYSGQRYLVKILKHTNKEKITAQSVNGYYYITSPNEITADIIAHINDKIDTYSYANKRFDMLLIYFPSESHYYIQKQGVLEEASASLLVSNNIVFKELYLMASAENFEFRPNNAHDIYYLYSLIDKKAYQYDKLQDIIKEL